MALRGNEVHKRRQAKRKFKIVPKGTFAARKAAAAKRKVTVRRQPNRLIQAGPGLTSFSSFRGLSRPLRLGSNVAAKGARDVYVINNPYTLEVVPGTQNTITMGTWFSVADIFTMSKNVPQPAPTGTILVPDLRVPTVFHLHGVQVNLDIVNATSGSCVVDIYDIVAKQDVPSSLITSDGFDVGTPYIAWETGMRHQSLQTAVPGPGPQDELGSLPTDSQLFNDYYQIKSKKTVLLGQNGLHNHKVSMTPNYTLDVNKAQVAIEYLTALKGITHFTMVVARGQVASNLDEPANTTTANALIRGVSTERYTYSWLQPSGKVWSSVVNVPQPDASQVRIMNCNNPSPGLVDTA